MRQKIGNKKLVQIQMPEQLEKALKDEAKRLNIDLSSFVRMTLTEKLQKKHESH